MTQHPVTTTDQLAAAVLDSLREPDAWTDTTPMIDGGRRVGHERWFNRDNIRLVFDHGGVSIHTFTPDRARLHVSTTSFTGVDPELVAMVVELTIENEVARSAGA
jgi:hypothetical protein